MELPNPISFWKQERHENSADMSAAFQLLEESELQQNWCTNSGENACFCVKFQKMLHYILANMYIYMYIHGRLWRKATFFWQSFCVILFTETHLRKNIQYKFEHLTCSSDAFSQQRPICFTSFWGMVFVTPAFQSNPRRELSMRSFPRSPPVLAVSERVEKTLPYSIGFWT